MTNGDVAEGGKQRVQGSGFRVQKGAKRGRRRPAAPLMMEMNKGKLKLNPFLLIFPTFNLLLSHPDRPSRQRLSAFLFIPSCLRRGGTPSPYLASRIL